MSRILGSVLFIAIMFQSEMLVFLLLKLCNMSSSSSAWQGSREFGWSFRLATCAVCFRECQHIVGIRLRSGSFALLIYIHYDDNSDIEFVHILPILIPQSVESDWTTW